jgi:hypothetical protein
MVLAASCSSPAAPGPLAEVKSQIEAAGATASLCAVDVGDRAALAAAIEKASPRNTPASTSSSTTPASPSDGLVLRMSDEDWDEVIRREPHVRPSSPSAPPHAP